MKNDTLICSREVAMDVGYCAAILLNHIKYWCEKNANKPDHMHDGRAWMYEKIEEMADALGTKKLRVFEALKILRDRGYISSAKFNRVKYDRTNWYTVLKYPNSENHNDSGDHYGKHNVDVMENITPSYGKHNVDVMESITTSYGKHNNEVMESIPPIPKSNSKNRSKNTQESVSRVASATSLSESDDIPEVRKGPRPPTKSEVITFVSSPHGVQYKITPDFAGQWYDDMTFDGWVDTKGRSVVYSWRAKLRYAWSDHRRREQEEKSRPKPAYASRDSYDCGEVGKWSEEDQDRYSAYMTRDVIED